MPLNFQGQWVIFPCNLYLHLIVAEQIHFGLWINTVKVTKSSKISSDAFHFIKQLLRLEIIAIFKNLQSIFQIVSFAFLKNSS